MTWAEFQKIDADENTDRCMICRVFEAQFCLVPCLHTYCSTCLEESKTNADWKCPKCDLKPIDCQNLETMIPINQIMSTETELNCENFPNGTDMLIKEEDKQQSDYSEILPTPITLENYYETSQSSYLFIGINQSESQEIQVLPFERDPKQYNEEESQVMIPVVSEIILIEKEVEKKSTSLWQKLKHSLGLVATKEKDKTEKPKIVRKKHHRSFSVDQFCDILSDPDEAQKMSKHVAKAVLRQAKNYTYGYSDIQVKVREATSNDPWGPSGSQMQEISDATYHPSEFMDIMELIDKRLNDSGKNWRHVYKALTLLDYLIHCGSEQVIAYAKQNLYVIKTLKEFQFIDEEGKDQGINVREKSKQIASLLSDDDRLKEERKARAALRERMAGGGSVSSQYQGSSIQFQGSGSGGGGDFAQRRSFAPPQSEYEENRQLEKALEESKRMAAEQERRQREQERQQLELQRALEQSKTDYRQQPQQQPLQNQQIDLWGSTTDDKKHELDFFSSLAAPQPVQTNQPDPFGFHPGTSGYQQQQQHDFFQSASFSQQALPLAQTGFGNTSNFNNASNATSNPFGQNTMQASFGQVAPYNQQNAIVPFNSQPQNASTQFGSSFDTGAGQKNFVPGLQSNNPNAQLAQIARNAVQIDPFANLAAGSQKGSLNDLSGSGGGFGQHQQQSNLFASPPMSRGLPPTMTPALVPSNAKSMAASSNSQPAPSKSADPFANLVSFGTSSNSNQNSSSQVSNAPKLNQMTNSGSGVFNPMSAPQQSNAYGGQMGGFGNTYGQPQQQMTGAANPFGGFGGAPQQQNSGFFNQPGGQQAGMNKMNSGFGGFPQQQQQPASQPPTNNNNFFF